MIHEQHSAELMPPQSEKKRGSLVQRLGLGAFTISLIVHGVFIILAIFFLYKWIAPPAEKLEQFVPGGGGGGSGGAEASHKIQQQMKKRMVAPAATKRIMSSSTSAAFSLPENNMEMMNSSVPMDVGTMSAGGGGGAGGGQGTGIGTGVGSGSGAGSGPGSGRGFLPTSPFGSSSANDNALVGTFYNFNKRANGNPSKISYEEYLDTIRDFATRNWKDSILGKFHKAPQQLYQTKVYLPAMAANLAPQAFDQPLDPKPCWAVVYRGIVKAPKTGRFRFVGAGDDLMVVRFNGQNVFDWGYRSGTEDDKDFRALLKGEDGKHKLRQCPMMPPVAFYQYPTTKDWNRNIGGMAVGPEVAVQAGQSYPVEILISEGKGGLFCATLMMEESDAIYQKASTGAPILPLFQTDANPPAKVTGDNSPPYEKQGPVWMVVPKNKWGEGL